MSGRGRSTSSFALFFSVGIRSRRGRSTSSFVLSFSVGIPIGIFVIIGAVVVCVGVVILVLFVSGFSIVVGITKPRTLPCVVIRSGSFRVVRMLVLRTLLAD